MDGFKKTKKPQLQNEDIKNVKKETLEYGDYKNRKTKSTAEDSYSLASKQ